MHSFNFSIAELMMFRNQSVSASKYLLTKLPDDLPVTMNNIPVAYNGQLRVNTDLEIQNKIWPAAELSGIHARAWGLGINGYA